MNFRTRLASVLAGVALLASPTLAADLTWDPSGTGSSDGAGTWLATDEWWDGATNVTWNNGTPDNAAIGNGGTGGTITVGAVTAGTLSLNNFTGTYTFDGTLGSSTLTQNGGITIGTTAGSVTFRNTVIAGSGGVTMNNAGRLILGGNPAVAHTYSGTTLLNAGVTMFGNNYSANSNITMNGGVLESYWNTAITQTLGTGANQIQIIGGESGFSLNGNTGLNVNLGGGAITWGTATFNPTKFVLQTQYSQTNSNLTFQNALDLNGATRTILVNSGTTGNARASISGLISNGTGTAGLTKEGDGRLLLTNNSNTWNGATTVSAGLFDIGGANLANIGGGSGRNISVADGASIRFNTLTNAVLNRIAETTNEIGVMAGNDLSAGLDFSSSTGANLPNAFLGNYATNGAKREIIGTITPGSNGYKLGARYSSGLLGIRSLLSGANTLTVGQTGSTGIRVNIVAANTHTGDTVINTGSKLTIGNNLALQDSVLDVGAAGGNFALAAGTLGGRVVGETASPSPTFGGLSGSRNLSSVFTTSGGNNEANLTANLITGFTLNVGDGKTVTYSGAIGGFGTGTTNNNGGGINGNSTLTKTGNGTQVLTGVSTYTGATLISGGTLRISGSGSINGTSGITLNGGQLDYTSSVALTQALTFTSGTLGGTNWTGALDNLVIGAGRTISPGNSPGTSSTGNQTWAAGGEYLWEINNATATAGSDPGWDLLSGTGTLDITATSGDEYTILITSLDLASDPGQAVNFVDSSSYEWLIAEFANPVTGFDASDFTVDTSAFQNVFTGTFGIARGDTVSGGTTNQIYITYVAVPEPAAIALATCGLIGLGLAARRRMRRS